MATVFTGAYRRITIVIEHSDPAQPHVAIEFDGHPDIGIQLNSGAYGQSIDATVYGTAVITQLGTVETPSEFLAAREAKEAR